MKTYKDYLLLFGFKWALVTYILVKVIFLFENGIEIELSSNALIRDLIIWTGVAIFNGTITYLFARKKMKKTN